MSFQVIVREIKPVTLSPMHDVKTVAGNTSEQIYEQTVEVLDLSRLIAAVNSRPRKIRRSTTAPTGK